jgi:hypothetical protein
MFFIAFKLLRSEWCCNLCSRVEHMDVQPRVLSIVIRESHRDAGQYLLASTGKCEDVQTSKPGVVTQNDVKDLRLEETDQGFIHFWTNVRRCAPKVATAWHYAPLFRMTVMPRRLPRYTNLYGDLMMTISSLFYNCHSPK